MRGVAIVKCLLNVCMIMFMAMDSGQLRIGEFARRVGVTPELLRAWESRYGLTRPVRSPGGFRLYTAADAARVKRMRRGLDEGLSAAEAARVALADERPSEGLLEDAAARLLAAIARYDEPAVHSVLDDSLAAFGLDESLRHVVLPTLKEVGDGWERGEIDISQEHFASNLIRGRLLALCPVLGPRRRPAGSPRLRTRRDARHHPARVRPRPALSLVADPLSRRGHSDRNGRPRGRDDAARASRRLELRPRPARGAVREPPPAGSVDAAGARARAQRTS